MYVVIISRIGQIALFVDDCVVECLQPTGNVVRQWSGGSAADRNITLQTDLYCDPILGAKDQLAAVTLPRPVEDVLATTRLVGVGNELRLHVQALLLLTRSSDQSIYS
ncbi:hypothetical protein EZV62_008894 [Acer yangbiense]|uniref:Uncharacterized protein n=1 Tax=Acer yangbiense TaxID=1000413 RepID=A0A5C7IF56_9ROSI|nr:hypothetical protein EZV62_008894 [Acer yangbiense]